MIKYTVKLAGFTSNANPSNENLIAIKEVYIHDNGAISFTNAAGRLVQITDCPYEFMSLLKQLVVSTDSGQLDNGAVPTSKKWRDAG